MKETIEQVLTSGNTTTSVSGFDSIATGVVGKVWLNELIAAAKKKMFFEQFAYIARAQQGQKDVAVPLYRSHISFGTTSTESVSREMTQIDNLTSVVFTPATVKMGAAISKDVVRTSMVDSLKHTREELMYDSALNIDTAFDTALHAAGAFSGTGPGSVSGTGTNAFLYGGGRAAEASIIAGDVLDTAIINKARRVLKGQGWYPEPDKPFVLFIPSIAEEALLNDSQFVNASEYGSNEIVMNGEIGKYLGIKVISTEQCSSVTINSLSGHYCYMAKAQVAYGICYGEEPSLGYWFNGDKAQHEIYLDMCYQVKLLQTSALVVMGVVDE